jgi:hypothetical protein
VGRWRLLLVGLPVGAVAGLAAWPLMAAGQSVWAVGVGVAGPVAGAFAPSVQDVWRLRWTRQERAAHAHAELAVAELPESVAWLLHPDRQVIGFFGRGWVLRRLENWCEDADASVVRLVTAPGGYGKSRLARRFADGLSGWQTWRVAVRAEQQAPTELSLYWTTYARPPSRKGRSRRSRGEVVTPCVNLRRRAVWFVRIL